MLNIVLVEPEIHVNVGNIGRTCVALGARLHLIKPLGFEITDKAVRRAGLDYWDDLDLTLHDSVEDFFQTYPKPNLWLATTKAPQDYSQAPFDQMPQNEDCFLFFGKESKGLPQDLRLQYADRCIRIPMGYGIRSLNLSNSVAILAYEYMRQHGFIGLQETGEMADVRPDTVCPAEALPI